ncbi:hypothetical protein LDVICp159 [lymphocystis disease virus-China]|uniref:Uncharacterized protein n=2 Tax=Lymphocystis disease virus 2 TaxID=159183 RepID=A0A6F8WZT2_9VIRU|nr:hypothetical protein LDVICp159 [lymphocystis disease virus-China]AAU11004.1 hypothetical protein [lymphocystis disease virus-China]BCB67507.1 hypothetical protein [Lymphocystis disease virus 2]
MNFFYFCEKYAFKTKEVLLDIDDLKLFDFQWPRRSENHFDQASIGSMAVVKSSIPGSDFTVLIKLKTNTVISLELIVFYNEYRVFNNEKLILKGQKTDFNTACLDAFDRIKRKYKCFLISSPKKVLTRRLSNNLELISETWFKFLEEAGMWYWGYVNDLNFTDFPRNTAVLCSSPWFYCESILEIYLSQSRNRLRIKMVKGIYCARCEELRFNLWHAESPWPLIDRFLKYYVSYLFIKPNNFVEIIPELRLETVIKEFNTFLPGKFWGNIVADHYTLETSFDEEIWTKLQENACVLYYTETEIPQYLCTIYADFSKYQIVYNPTGFLIKRTLKKLSSNVFRSYDRELIIDSLKHLEFNFVHSFVPSLQQLSRCNIDLKTISTELKIRYFNF